MRKGSKRYLLPLSFLFRVVGTTVVLQFTHEIFISLYESCPEFYYLDYYKRIPWHLVAIFKFYYVIHIMSVIYLDSDKSLSTLGNLVYPFKVAYGYYIWRLIYIFFNTKKSKNDNIK